MFLVVLSGATEAEAQVVVRVRRVVVVPVRHGAVVGVVVPAAAAVDAVRAGGSLHFFSAEAAKNIGYARINLFSHSQSPDTRRICALWVAKPFG